MVEELKIVAPVFRREDIIAQVTALRPFRRGGLRLERESVGGKVVYHNYGHGAYGLNLAYGTALRTVEQFAREFPDASGEVVSVIGGGIVGLSTALILLERGYRVRLIAKQFIEPLELDARGFQRQALVTSQLAAGQIISYEASLYADFAQTLSRAEIDASHAFYAASCASRRFRGLALQTQLDFSDDPYTGEGFCKRGRFVRAGTSSGAGQLRRCFRSDIIVVSSQFIFDLFAHVQQLGATLETRELTRENFAQLDARFVFNCSGLGAHAIFGDDSVYPVFGQLIYLRKQPGVDYSVICEQQGRYNFYFFAHEDKIVLGGVFQEKKLSFGEFVPDLQESERILREANEFFGAQPRL